VNCKRTGLTLIEMLVVLAIITVLVGIFVPTAAMVQKSAKEAKQKAQFSVIELALEAFKNDYSDYPPSYGGSPATLANYCGAQKLAEALLGWDLLGFHPSSDFKADGCTSKGVKIYDVNNPVFFDQRKGTYLDIATANVFRLGNISAFKPGLYYNTTPLAPDTYVLCDVFGGKKIKLINGTTVSAGAPILYFRADPTKKTIREIYNVYDNLSIAMAKNTDDGRDDPLFNTGNQYTNFYSYIRDPKREAMPWPYRSDSYILISAGADGLYGTGDDIRNFGN
jgi:prepilin-type N-terminal cleavage/methylation domain-containing protein